MSNKKYIDGLHRPYNMPLKEVVWVCQFLKIEGDKYDKKYYYVAFWVYFINATIDNGDKNINDENGIISYQKALKIKKWIDVSHSIKNIFDRISEILKHPHIGEEKDVYSSYKNTSYYITLTRKLNFLVNQWELSKSAIQLVRINRSFYGLTKGQKDIIFRMILEADQDFFVPLLYSMKYETDSLFLKKGDLELQFLSQIEGMTFFKYIRKSIQSNYIKVRYEWVAQLDVLNSYNNIRSTYMKSIEDVCGKPYINDIKERFNTFAKHYVFSENNKMVKFNTFERQYKKLKKRGKDDLGFVNLYDIKCAFRLSIENFEKLVADYMLSVTGKKIVMLSNTVMSIDGRPRFLINGVVALRVKIIDKII